MVSDEIDLTKATFVIGDGLGVGASNVSNIVVGNLEVSTLKFKSMYLDILSETSFGCIATNAEQLEIDGVAIVRKTLEVDGKTTLNSDLELKP